MNPAAATSIQIRQRGRPREFDVHAAIDMAIGSTVPSGMPFANRLRPVENLLRQNASI